MQRSDVGAVGIRLSGCGVTASFGSVGDFLDNAAMESTCVAITKESCTSTAAERDMTRRRPARSCPATSKSSATVNATRSESPTAPPGRVLRCQPGSLICHTNTSTEPWHLQNVPRPLPCAFWTRTWTALIGSFVPVTC